MAMTPDPWIILPREKTRYEEQFKSLNPVNGIVTGEQAKGFLLQSQLPPHILGQIWALADTDSDGKMDFSEFSIACKLINLKLRNFELPKLLPLSLLQSAKSAGTFGMAPPAIPPLPQPSALAALGQTPVSVNKMPSVISSLVSTGPSITSPVPPLIPAPPATRPPIPKPPLPRPMIGVPSGVLPSPPQNIPQNVLSSVPVASSSFSPRPLMMGGSGTTSVNVMGNTVGVMPVIPVSPAVQDTASHNAPIMSATAPLVMMPPTMPAGVSQNLPQQPMIPGIIGQTIPSVRPPVVQGTSSQISPIISASVMMPSTMPTSMPLNLSQQQVIPGLIGPNVPPPRPPSVTSAVVSSSVSALERIGSIESPLSSGPILQEWSVPHQTKLKYTQLFNTTDRTRTGFLSGPQARNIMVQTQLPQPVLAQIWTLADMDSDGRLSCDEFVLAMHLCDLAKQGETIPVVLPADLIPPAFRRARQGSLQGTSAVSGDQAEGKDSPLGLSTVTFEDKRKENFEKGQAELEKRRKALMEIQKKEQEERERKEKEEQEKKEKIRLEQEHRRQVELEKQLQKQREIEQEKEEQRRKAQEQREAARREMERQRQLEWEKQRSQDLQLQRQKEQENVLQLKAKNQNLKIELTQLTDKVKELSQKITETRLGVTSVKSTIDGMRTTRDTQLSEMSLLKARLKEQNQRLVALSQEKIRLEARNKMNSSNTANEEQLKLAFTNKQIMLKQLRDRLEDLNKEVEAKLSDIENNNSQLGDLKQQLGSLISDCEEVYSLYEERRQKVSSLKSTQNNADYSLAWGDNTNVSGWETTANAAWSDATNENIQTSKDMLKYKALYEFVARNADELSFQPGDIIMVPVTQNAEPGWLAGELQGYTGWFPETYVELIDSPVPVDVQPVAAFSLTEMNDANQNKAQLQEKVEMLEHTTNKKLVDSNKDVGPPVSDFLTTPVLGQGVAVNNVQYQALYSWQGEKDSHLTLKENDIITVKEEQDDWYYGEIAGGSKGWFPKSYVTVVDIAAVSSSVTENDELCVAMFPYQSSELGDLSFQQGEIITVVRKDGEWWTGIIGDRRGIFPSNYVQKTEIKSPKSAPVEQKVIETPQKISDVLETPPPKASSGDARTKGKKPEIATVIAPYQATSSEQLSLQRGQLIMIRKKTSTGWWEGELQAKGKKKQIGWFPASYVKLLGTKEKQEEQQPNSLQQSPSPSAQQEEKVIALFPYQAQNEDELSFLKDDVITLVAKEEASWWKGELNGVCGLFPSNYVAPMYEVQITEMEKKRQDYIDELLSTEEAYIDDMTVVHEVFEKPLQESKILTEEEVQKIFVNWKEIIVCNHIFLRALRVRRDMSNNGVIRMIGDILCENLPRMTAYIRFCSCQLSAAKFLQHVTETSPKFKELARQCQCDPRTKGMPLSSFLIKPMQRITKYPLLIKKILQYTPASHPDRDNLCEALAKAEEFCMQVNEGVREQENSDRLEWLQRQVNCEGLEEELVFNSLTNCLGPRKLLHFGILHKVKSGKELVGFLFNDFLLFAQSNKSIGPHGFAFDMHTNNTFKLYKKPVLLSHLILVNDDVRPVTPVGGTDVSDSQLRMLKFQDTQNKTLYSLLTPSAKDQIVWHKKITEALESYAETQKKHLQYQKSKAAQFGACGRILVVVVKGVGLKPISSTGKCNVFCKVSMGFQENRTCTVHLMSEALWNSTMQFLIKDVEEDVLCITVFDEGHFSPDEFLGRAEIRVRDVCKKTKNSPGPVHSRLKLREVDSGEIMLKLDLIIFPTET